MKQGAEPRRYLEYLMHTRKTVEPSGDIEGFFTPHPYYASVAQWLARLFPKPDQRGGRGFEPHQSHSRKLLPFFAAFFLIDLHAGSSSHNLSELQYDHLLKMLPPGAGLTDFLCSGAVGFDMQH